MFDDYQTIAVNTQYFLHNEHLPPMCRIDIRQIDSDGHKRLVHTVVGHVSIVTSLLPADISKAKGQVVAFTVRSQLQ